MFRKFWPFLPKNGVLSQARALLAKFWVGLSASGQYKFMPMVKEASFYNYGNNKIAVRFDRDVRNGGLDRTKWEWII